jgi:cytochrome c oxidase cbb3-type subunit 3
MPTWGAILGPQGVRDVTAYVLTLRNTNLPGKPPQGEDYSGI